MAQINAGEYQNPRIEELLIRLSDRLSRTTGKKVYGYLKLKLFFEWGIRFEKPLQMEDRGSRPVHYADKAELEKAILSEYPLVYSEESLPVKSNLKAASMPEKTALKT